MKVAPDGGGRKKPTQSQINSAMKKAKTNRPFQNPPVMHLPSGTPGAKPLPGGFFDKPPTSTGSVPPMSKAQGDRVFKESLKRRNPKWDK